MNRTFLSSQSWSCSLVKKSMEVGEPRCFSSCQALITFASAVGSSGSSSPELAKYYFGLRHKSDGTDTFWILLNWHCLPYQQWRFSVGTTFCEATNNLPLPPCYCHRCPCCSHFDARVPAGGCLDDDSAGHKLNLSVYFFCKISLICMEGKLMTLATTPSWKNWQTLVVYL